MPADAYICPHETLFEGNIQQYSNQAWIFLDFEPDEDEPKISPIIMCMCGWIGGGWAYIPYGTLDIFGKFLVM